MNAESAFHALYIGALVILAILMGIMVVRSVIGPRVTDRILSINMIGTMVVCSIAILTVLLDEGYLADVALIYVMISFVAVLILAITYIPEHPRRTEHYRLLEMKEDTPQDEEGGDEE
ncbi:MAG: sodium:proton antiporter [Blautia sp.]|nr:sodium:proton antiporter [Blautia sp.]